MKEPTCEPFLPPSTVATAKEWPPTPGQLFYGGFRGDKGGRTRTGAIMHTWRELVELAPDVARAYEAAGQAAQEGRVASQCYAIYLAARQGQAWDGSTAPGWEGLQDQRAWTAGALAVRLG